MYSKLKISRFKKLKPQIISGFIHINATSNNTIITITNKEGNTICWSSAGSIGFKSARKSTAFAAQTTAETVIKNALSFGLKTVNILVKGLGSARETAIYTIKTTKLKILSITDVITIPYNGCRPPKKPRV